MNWTIEATEEFDGWLQGLSARAQEKVVQAVNWLEVEGPNLGRPRVDTVSGSSLRNLKELRVPVGRQVLRIFFVFDPERRGLLLCGGDKAGQNEKRFYKTMIEVAERLHGEYITGETEPASLNRDPD